MNDWRAPNDPARSGANERTWQLMVAAQAGDQIQPNVGEATAEVGASMVPPDSEATATEPAVRHGEVTAEWEELHRAARVIIAMTGFREALKAVPERVLVEQLLESLDAEMLTVGRIVLDRRTTNGDRESLRASAGTSLTVIEWLVSTLERSAAVPMEELSRMYPILATVRGSIK